jgi:hypothetical protein
MEKERMEKEFKIQPSLQIEENINANEREKWIKENWFKLYLHKRKWAHDKRNALCWSFNCVNYDNKSMDVKCFQLMKCILCYANLILISNAKTQARKGLILCNSANGIVALKKKCMHTIVWLQKYLKK